jgi:hypothetical protein
VIHTSAVARQVLEHRDRKIGAGDALAHEDSGMIGI